MSAANPGSRVVVTSYEKSGKSIIDSDVVSNPIRLPNNDGDDALEFSPFHALHNVPVKRAELFQKAHENLPPIPRASAEGVLFGSIDFPAGFRTAMHHTLSLDYGVILSGEVTLVLDGGEETLLKPGDVVIQRGTEHAWFNHGTDVCRMIFVAVTREKTELEAGESV